MSFGFLVKIANGIIKLLAKVLDVLFILLPGSPFKLVYANDTVVSYLGYINWLVPVGILVSITELWLVAVSAFYLVQIPLRWAKASGD